MEEFYNETERERSEKKSLKAQANWQLTLLQYLHDIVYLLAIILIAFLLLFRVVVVSGTSMNDTLMDGDYLLLLGDAFYREPEYGDIIVASKKTFDDGLPIVKRVIATEGQWVDIDFAEGIVYVGDDLENMQALEEPYTKTLTTNPEGYTFPLQVNDGCIFVLGDNRRVSKDSRSLEIGQIDKREVLGKVIFLFMPGTNGTDAYGNPNVPRDYGRIGVVK